MHLRPVGRLVLKGKRKGIAVHEPVSGEDARSSAPRAAYDDAYALMEAHDPRAADTFAELARRYPDDSLVAYHARRLAAGAGGATITLESK